MINDAMVYLSGTYINLYLQYTGSKKKGTNIECPNRAQHASGKDSNPSCTVNNTSGLYHCHTCGDSGNFINFYNNYIKPGEGGKHIIEWIEENLPGLTQERYSDINKHRNDESFNKLLKDIEDKRQKYESSTRKGNEIIEGGDEYVKVCMNKLLSDNDSIEYLNKTRYITPQLIEKFQLGIDDSGAFTIPIRDKNGQLLNIKKYNPRSLDKSKKWSYKVNDRKNIPNPYSAFSHETIVIFEGEPDMYCARAHGIHSAVTFGAAGIRIPDVLGDDMENLLYGKNIIIVFDADETGTENAYRVAADIYDIVDQIKIIDLNKSKSNSFGLDPDLLNDNGKRVEKDFTDFLKKNGFGEPALDKFNRLVQTTEAYYQNESRSESKEVKINLSEAKKGVKYYDSYGNTILRLTAEVEEKLDAPYKYDRHLNVKCPRMDPDSSYTSKTCDNCRLMNIIRDDQEKYRINGMDITINTFGDNREEMQKEDVMVEPIYIFDMAKSPLDKYEAKRKEIVGIPKTCSACNIMVKSIYNLIEVTLKTTTENFNENSDNDVNIYDYKAFILDKKNDIEIETGRTYGFKGYISYDPAKASSVFFADDYIEVMNTHEKFNMTEEIHDMLKSRFKPDNWTIDDIDQELNYRYSIYQDAMGIVGREDLVFGVELVTTSILNMAFDGLPSIQRGWLELAAIGDSRTGKSIIIRWFDNHFGINSYITCTTVSRAGLLSGVTNDKIKFGLLARKHRGMLLFDEASHLSTDQYRELNTSRSDGLIQSVQIKSGSTWGKNRKVFIANPRGDDKIDQNLASFVRKQAIQEFLDLFGSAPAVQRFDIGMRLFADDVSIEDLKTNYKPIVDQYTSYECNTLRQFAWTRNAKTHVKFEDGFEEKLIECTNRMMAKYHENTQLVSIEIKTKLVRMAQALAVLLYSVEDSNINQVIVRKVFLEYMTMWLIKIYDGKNMQLDVISKKMREAETIGPRVDLLTGVFDDKSVSQMIQAQNFEIKNLYIWLDSYLDAVQRGYKKVMDNNANQGYSVNTNKSTTLNKLLDFMGRNNCITISGDKCKITAPFRTWVNKVTGENNGVFPVSNKLDVAGGMGEPNDSFNQKIAKAKKVE